VHELATLVICRLLDHVTTKFRGSESKLEFIFCGCSKCFIGTVIIVIIGNKHNIRRETADKSQWDVQNIIIESRAES
jgi:hypothetical protein